MTSDGTFTSGSHSVRKSTLGFRGSFCHLTILDEFVIISHGPVWARSTVMLAFGFCRLLQRTAANVHSEAEIVETIIHAGSINAL